MKNLRMTHGMLRLALLALATCVAPIANAITFEVDTTADLPDDGFGLTTCHTSEGTCSLRAAIMKANQVDDGTSIIHIPEGTYTLTIPPSGDDGDDRGDLNITTSVAITGAGAGRTIIDGNATDRVFDIAVGRFVGLTGLTVRNGNQRESGGGIRSAGILTVDRCTIEDNTTVANGITGDGAGIYSSGSLTIYASTIRSNHVQGAGNGGGIGSFGTAVIRTSTISGNVAANGGGIFVVNHSQYLFVLDSTISGNAAYNDGGGIFSVEAAGSSDVVGLYSTSVLGNDASSDSDGSGAGGGVYAPGTNGARFIVANTIIANNTINGRDAFDDCVGAIEAYGANLYTTAVPFGCAVGGNGSDALRQVSLETIGPLQDNGGPTLTHALLTNSEAIDGTTSQGCIDMNGTLLTGDQRDAPRIFGGRCDIGAYEYGAVVDVIFRNSFN
jgi:hypothetical protein